MKTCTLASVAIRLVVFTIVLQGTGHAATFELPDAGVVFEAPSGFTVLSQTDLIERYPDRRPSLAAVGNERRTTTIAYELTNKEAPLEALVMAKADIEKIWCSACLASNGSRRTL